MLLEGTYILGNNITTVKMMNTEPLIRITVCVNRKKGTTEKEFNDYWANHHGPLAIPWLKRCGILRYVQVSVPYQLDY